MTRNIIYLHISYKLFETIKVALMDRATWSTKVDTNTRLELAGAMANITYVRLYFEENVYNNDYAPYIEIAKSNIYCGGKRVDIDNASDLLTMGETITIKFSNADRRNFITFDYEQNEIIAEKNYEDEQRRYLYSDDDYSY